jgi:arylsulfatase A-like enzyme
LITWILATLLGCTPQPPPEPDQLVILISIDTLRADHLGCYDHPWVQTPNIDQLAADGELFRRQVSAAPTTLNSHTSIMTGTYPHRHGVPRNGYVVDPQNLMLAEMFQSNDWQTGAFIAGYPLHSRFGFNQGFDDYDEEFQAESAGISVRHSQRDGEAVTDATLGWLDRKFNKDTFLFVHYFDVHLPYVVPEPYHSQYLKQDSVMKGTTEDVAKVQRRFARGDHRVWKHSMALSRRYAGAVSYVDYQVGRLLDGLRERGIYDNALIVLTSDHGETMGEHPAHEVWSHGWAVFDTTLHTPLIFRRPDGQRGRRIQAQVSSVDIAPTLLDLLGIEVRTRFDGVSLGPGLRDEGDFESRWIFSQATKPKVETGENGWANGDLARAVHTANYKFIIDPQREQELFFHLLADPGEQTNLISGDPEQPGQAVVRQLSQRMERWVGKADPLPTKIDEGDEATGMLQALGYVEDEEAPAAPEDFQAPTLFDENESEESPE